MSDILVRPPQLRSMAQTIRQRARVIRASLEQVDRIIGQLKPVKFEGQRATHLQSRYASAREKIFQAPTLLEAFAQALEQAAAVFEQADRGSETGRGDVEMPIPVPVPTPTPPPGPIPAPPTPPTGPGNGDTGDAPKDDATEDLLKKYDGKSYADGTYNPNDSYSARPVNPPLTNTAGDRDPNTYSAVLNQFGVETNPRYDQRNGNTYCNIYVWDATKAMGAEIPHWVDSNGAAVAVGKGSELNANGVVSWLEDHGNQNGWRAVSAEEAQSLANNGNPAVAVWQNPGGIGHVAMVRPGEYSAANGPAIAQAGGQNINSGRVGSSFSHAWKNGEMQYYVHN